VTLDRHEKLMLGRGQAERSRLGLAPVQETAQGVRRFKSGRPDW
jgi:hypothetical protein